MDSARIPDEEFTSRIYKAKELMEQNGIDVLFCFGNETEPQNIRYFCNYWPSFESAGVVISLKDEPILIIGPESETYATDVSKIKSIRKVLAFRESSEPEYPDVKLSTLEDVFLNLHGHERIKRFGIAGMNVITHSVYQNVQHAIQSIGDIEIVKADGLVAKLRSIKSPHEIACLRESYRICQSAMKEAIENIKIGMTENQVKGIALAKSYQLGSEGEAYASWILTGAHSNQAISRCRNKVIQSGDLVQLQVSARYHGYASTMGRPVIMGKATKGQSNMIQAAYAAQHEILATAKAGVHARSISEVHKNVLERYRADQYILYGPCHGTGLMEGEYPWIESSSDFILEEGMTFCTCLYLGDNERSYGIRVEDGFLITSDGTESLSDYRRELIEVIT